MVLKNINAKNINQLMFYLQFIFLPTLTNLLITLP
jgi:hypothetical protein